MRVPDQTAVAYQRAEGAPVVCVLFHESVEGSYTPPVFVWPAVVLPPQITIFEPVQTATWMLRAAGACTGLMGDQLSVTGLYRPPVP